MRRLVVGAMLMAACHGADAAPFDAEISVQENVVWAGSEAVLVSLAFAGADTLPAVLLNNTALPSRYLGNQQVAVRMPDSAGSWSLSVQLASGGVGLTPVVQTAGGLLSLRQGLPAWAGFEWPRQSGRIVVNVGLTAGPLGGVGILDLSNPSVIASLPIPDSLGGRSLCQRKGTGYSTVGGLVITGGDGACGWSRAWVPDATGRLVAVDSTYWSQQAAYLGGGWWLKDMGDSFYSISPYGTAVLLEYAASNGMVWSPRGDRAIPRDGGSFDSTSGVPVFDLVARSVAFRVPDRRTAGADFTEFGDTLLLATWVNNGQGFQVRAFDATNGTLLVGSDSIAGIESGYVVAEPRQPWIYVGVLDADTLPSVIVMDRRTMRPVAHLVIPAALRPTIGNRRFMRNCEMYLAAAERRLYVFDTDQGRVFAFGLLP